MDSAASVAVPDAANDQKSRPTTKKPVNRPAMQIYRPPGLRSGGAAHSPPDSQRENGAGTPPTLQMQQRESVRDRDTQRQPTETAGSKPSLNQRLAATPPGDKRVEENNNHRTSPPIATQRLNRTESNLSSESALSQKSTASGGASLGSAGNGETTEKQRKKGPTPPRMPKEKPKKVMSPKELLEAATSLRALQLTNNAAELEQFIANDFACDQSAECLGSSLAQHAIEGGSGCAKQVTKACGLLRETPSFPALSKGLLNSISQYFDCRDRLRQEHFRMWISFLNFVSDLYSNVGCTPTGELVNVVFQVFDFLLRAPVLESLKIEELESLISSLLSVGYDLERDCPDQLSALKDLIRDAFIEVQEPWARKMILLLLELGASGWKLPPEANEYYFQQGNN